jgi:hypothetical protein
MGSELPLHAASIKISMKMRFISISWNGADPATGARGILEVMN